MNISSTSYNTYTSGWNNTAVSREKPDKTNPFTKTDPIFNPVVKTNPAQQIAQALEPDTQSLEKKSSDQKSSSRQRTAETTTVNKQEFTPSEIQLLEQLKQADMEVRQHEMAHIAAGGRYITSGATFTYKRGPDGKNYVVGGEVGIDTSPVPGDPQATMQKMRQIKSAALAPANPSSQDLKVASKATSNASKALSDLMTQQAEEQASSQKDKAFGNLKNAVASYVKVGNLPESNPSSLQIAV